MDAAVKAAFDCHMISLHHALKALGLPGFNKVALDRTVTANEQHQPGVDL